jgi:hypothetical protein
MTDVLCLLLIFLCFGVAQAYTAACERLKAGRHHD